MSELLRNLTSHDAADLAERAQRIWLNGQEQGTSVFVSQALRSFGPWRRIGQPAFEVNASRYMALFRHAETDEFAVITWPEPREYSTAEDVVQDFLRAARTNAAGDYLALWRWVLDRRPTWPAIAMVFIRHLANADEGTRFLAAFANERDTYAQAADLLAAALLPRPTRQRDIIDREFWDVPDETVRDKVTAWAREEAERFIATVPTKALALAEDDFYSGEVVAIFETFAREQHQHDPTVNSRVEFTWAVYIPE